MGNDLRLRNQKYEKNFKTFWEHRLVYTLYEFFAVVVKNYAKTVIKVFFVKVCLIYLLLPNIMPSVVVLICNRVKYVLPKILIHLFRYYIK